MDRFDTPATVRLRHIPELSLIPAILNVRYARLSFFFLPSVLPFYLPFFLPLYLPTFLPSDLRLFLLSFLLLLFRLFPRLLSIFLVPFILFLFLRVGLPFRRRFNSVIFKLLRIDDSSTDFLG